MVELEKVIDFHTFSITARDRGTGAFGVAVATARPNVGSLVPWVSPLVAAIREPRMYHNLRVDDHADPVAELRRVWAVVVAHTKQIETEYGPAALRLFGRVKW